MIEASLVSVCDFLKRQSFFEYEPVAESLSWLGQIHSRGWLYTSSCGEEILAVAAAFRIREWNDEYLRRLPDQEEGDKLYIPFFSSVSRSPAAALKLLREYLRNHPGITEIIYHRKKGWSGLGTMKRFPSNRVTSRMFGDDQAGFSSRSSRMTILPPKMIPAKPSEESVPAAFPPEEDQIRLVCRRLMESAGRSWLRTS